MVHGRDESKDFAIGYQDVLLIPYGTGLLTLSSVFLSDTMV